MTKIVATAPVVRAAFAEGLFTVPEGVSSASLTGTNGGPVRGRIHPALVAALVEAHPRRFSAPEKTDKAEKVVKTVAVPRFSQSTGRAIKAATLPIAEVRTLAGKPGSKGRLAKADLTAAAVALGFGPVTKAEVATDSE
jgi:hypothetical protein